MITIKTHSAAMNPHIMATIIAKRTAKWYNAKHATLSTNAVTNEAPVLGEANTLTWRSIATPPVSNT
jgi:hypothetical protein